MVLAFLIKRPQYEGRRLGGVFLMRAQPCELQARSTNRHRGTDEEISFLVMPYALALYHKRMPLRLVVPSFFRGSGHMILLLLWLVAHEGPASEIVGRNLEQLCFHCRGHVEARDEVPDGGLGDSPLHAGEGFEGFVGLRVPLAPQHRLQGFCHHRPGLVQILWAKAGETKRKHTYLYTRNEEEKEKRNETLESTCL